jgi:hypothetical protein
MAPVPAVMPPMAITVANSVLVNLEERIMKGSFRVKKSTEKQNTLQHST